MSFNLIRVIAAYEMRTLSRSWFFRIFAALTIIGLGIFNLAVNLQSSGSPWIYKALSASIPYANLIILNFGQAIVAVFLASEFLKQDKKNDTVEVIYARSMSNGQYIFGKTLGILSVFFILNIIVLLIGIGFSFFSHTGAPKLFAFLLYPLLISVPTLVFILGLSFFMMILIKNQAVTFIVILGYIAVTIFYLGDKAYHLFDYIANKVPMMHSSISGFASMKEIIIHRSIYLLAGTGLIFLTTYKLDRLPESMTQKRTSLFIGLLFLLVSSYFVYNYIDLKKSIANYKLKAENINRKYYSYPAAKITECSIDLEHQGKTINVRSELKVVNETQAILDTIIISLNPGLKVLNITDGNQNQLTFQRDLQIIKIKTNQPFNPGEEISLKIDYAGTINENIAYLDKDPDDFEYDFIFEVYTIRKRFAFLQNDFVCLTGDILWYPISGISFIKEHPVEFSPDFVKYTLKVKTDPKLMAISQGKTTSLSAGTYEFNPEYPLPAITLVIGNYIHSSIRVDSVEYSIYTTKGHEYYKEFFDEIQDTLPTVISDLKTEFESKTGLKYPFNRLMLVEVPLNFALDQHIYSYASPAIQPEMILSSEKGVLFRQSDFRYTLYREKNRRGRQSEETSPKELQVRVFNQFFRDNFITNQESNFSITTWQTYSLVPQYASFNYRINSDQWNIINNALEIYLGDKVHEKNTGFSIFQGLTKDEKINIELTKASFNQLLETGIEKEESENNQENITLKDVIYAKGLYLVDILKAKYGEADVDTLILKFMKENSHQTVPFEDLKQEFYKEFGINLEENLQSWFSQIKVPGFLVKDISSYKVMDGEAVKYQVRFKVYNREETDGILTMDFEFKDDNNNNRRNFFSNNINVGYTKKQFFPADSSYEIGFLFSTEPTRMVFTTHISQNLPNRISRDLTGFEETRRTAPLDTIVKIKPYQANQNEIIIDNEDKGFSFDKSVNQAYLKSRINRNKTNVYKYTFYNPFRAPKEWQPVVRSEFYGEYISSSYYTQGGDGQINAYWETILPETGNYDVYFYYNENTISFRRRRVDSDYNFTIYNGEGSEKLNWSSTDADPGWNYLGTYTFYSDSAKIGLSNQSRGDVIFADAIKLILTE